MAGAADPRAAAIPSMSILIVLVPPRARAAAGGEPVAAADTRSTAWPWLLSVDGRSVAAQGEGGVAEWPPSDETVAVLADTDVAWLQAPLPKAPAARLPQALLGLLEERLLDEQPHFALAPGAVAGQDGWIAVVDRPWLAATLQALEAAGRAPQRVVPLLQPTQTPQGHFSADPLDANRLRLAWSDARGAVALSVDGGLARSLVDTAGARWSAAPACAAAAQAWLGHPVAALGDGERLLRAAAGGWNLRQFGLAARRHGSARLAHAWRGFRGPGWRPVRLGLLALLALNLAGLNAWAWQQQAALSVRRQSMVDLLRQTHPQLRAILDPVLQMDRETDRLRAAAGQPGEDDLETLLAVAAAAWPDDEPPVRELQFEPGRLVLAIEGWDAARSAALRDQLAPAGWRVDAEGGRLTLRRAPEERER